MLSACINTGDMLGRVLCGEAKEPMTAPYRQRLNRVTCDGSACRMRHATSLKAQLLALGGVYLGVSWLCLLFAIWSIVIVAIQDCSSTSLSSSGQVPATCSSPWVFYTLFVVFLLGACACAGFGVHRRSTYNRFEEPAPQAEDAGAAPTCPACRGRHRAHTCGKGGVGVK